MNEPISHHYLPVFYLRQWTRGDGRLLRYYRPNREVIASPISPKRTGFEDGLYTLEGANNAQLIETEFFVDNDAAPVLELLLTTGPGSLDNSKRRSWTLFAMSLLSRSPHSLGEIKGVLDRNFRGKQAQRP